MLRVKQKCYKKEATTEIKSTQMRTKEKEPELLNVKRCTKSANESAQSNINNKYPK